jgi:hypothetical protein
MCERVAMPGGGVAIVCGVRRAKPKPCAQCGHASTVLCDGPPRDSGRLRSVTCDRPLCGRCRIHVPPNRDFCREHRAAARDSAAQLRLFDQEAR